MAKIASGIREVALISQRVQPGITGPTLQPGRPVNTSAVYPGATPTTALSAVGDLDFDRTVGSVSSTRSGYIAVTVGQVTVLTALSGGDRHQGCDAGGSKYVNSGAGGNSLPFRSP